jgi:RNA polymerase-interacting CarD/CdnL/TRCF family regulator
MFQVGDKVIHWSYGLGEIIKLDEKTLSGQKARYYVVRVQNLTIWVPLGDDGKSNLRPPTPKSDFENLFAILRSPGEPLSNDRLERKTQLMEKMKNGSLQEICQVVRDLSFLRRGKKLNDNDVAILKRAHDFLIDEWKLSMIVPPAQAERELIQLLAGELGVGG